MIDEDVFPDLYRRLFEIDNPRARAGESKRLADDHVLRVGRTVPAPEAGQSASRSPFEDVAENPSKAVAATEPVASSNTAEIDDVVAPKDALNRRTEPLPVDAIADHFAAF